MKTKEELLLNLKEKLLREYRSIIRGYSVVSGSDIAQILEGVAADIPIAGFLSVFLFGLRIFPNQASEPVHP